MAGGDLVVALLDRDRDDAHVLQRLERGVLLDVHELGNLPGVARLDVLRREGHEPEHDGDDHGADGEDRGPGPHHRRAALRAGAAALGELTQRELGLGDLVAAREQHVGLIVGTAELRHGAGEREGERLTELGRRLEPAGAILRERVQHDALELRRDRGVALGGRLGSLADVLVGDRDRGVAAEGDVAGQQLVEQDADRVEVGAGVDRLALRLLGREVRGGAEDRSAFTETALASERERDPLIHIIEETRT